MAAFWSRGLRAVQEYRVQGPRRDLPGDADLRGDGAHHHEERQCDRLGGPGEARGDQGPARIRSHQGEKRPHLPRGDRGRHQRVGRANMAAVAKKTRDDVKQYNFAWVGKDKTGKVIKGETRASGDAAVSANLRRQGIQVTSVKKVKMGGGKKITEKDITIFTRQLAVMMKAGVPLLQ